MDSYSGSCPQTFISFCLDMSSEREMPKSTVPSGDENGSTEVEQQGNATQVDPIRPLSQTSFSSPSTEESVSAFIERIATCMGFPTKESEVSDIPIPMPATVTSTIFPELLKVSVSDPIVVSQDAVEEKTGPANEPESTSQSKADPLYGDTSAEVTTPTSGSGYSRTDHQPLSVLRRPRETDVATPSPPRKRRKLLSKPGKVMKDAYFKGIQWTRTFVSGPLDPVHNKFKFYCMLCKTNVSIYSKGARENLRHYRTEGHLRKDQKWRYEHLQETDEITGNVTHQVRGKDGWVLTPVELEKEKPLFMDVPLVEAGDRFPFFEVYMATLMT